MLNTIEKFFDWLTNSATHFQVFVFAFCALVLLIGVAVGLLLVGPLIPQPVWIALMVLGGGLGFIWLWDQYAKWENGK